MAGTGRRGWGSVLATVAVLGLSALGAVAGAADKPKLQSSDCVKCHDGPPADVLAAGGKHAEVSCGECHEGHRPASKKNIPACSQCHEGQPHYDLKACLGCHKNPHRPLDLALTETLTDPCLTCHKDQIKQLKEHKSKHTALACTKCHRVHRTIPECLQCHKPHSPQQAAGDCKQCHKAHMPAVVTYATNLPGKECAACHQKAFDLLKASQAKHQRLDCVYCHKERHRNVPPCTNCHANPHPAGILAKFPRCGECHNTAHDLNHWTTAAKPAAKPAAKAPKKK